jgi:hypothetical protein
MELFQQMPLVWAFASNNPNALLFQLSKMPFLQP